MSRCPLISPPASLTYPQRHDGANSTQTRQQLRARHSNSNDSLQPTIAMMAFWVTSLSNASHVEVPQRVRARPETARPAAAAVRSWSRGGDACVAIGSHFVPKGSRPEDGNVSQMALATLAVPPDPHEIDPSFLARCPRAVRRRIPSDPALKAGAPGCSAQFYFICRGMSRPRRGVRF
jgi:hypothetical protein